jgi:hypothetical protein
MYKTNVCPVECQYTAAVRREISRRGETFAQTQKELFLWILSGLMLQEERFGSKEKADQYADKISQLARDRTNTSSHLAPFIHYVRFLTAPRSTWITSKEAQMILSFLKDAKKLMEEHNTPALLEEVPLRSKIFLEGPVFQLLSAGPQPSEVADNDRQWVVNKDEPTDDWPRTAMLIYVTLALWDYRTDPKRIARFLDHLLTLRDKHNLGRFPARESLVFVLLEESYAADLKTPGRAWRTGDLLRIYKMLRDLNFVFNELLYSYLTLNQPGLYATFDFVTKLVMDAVR